MNAEILIVYDNNPNLQPEDYNVIRLTADHYCAGIGCLIDSRDCMLAEKIKIKYNGNGGIREMLNIALPMILSTSCDAIMIFSTRLFLSRLGPEYMNAAIGGGVMNQVLVFFFTGLIGYSTALTAQYYGSGRNSLSTVTAFQAIIISVLAYPVILMFVPVAERLFFFIGTPVKQIGYQVKYFEIICYGTLPSMIRQALGCYFTGIGRTRIVLSATFTALVMNIVIGYLLIFGKYHMPAMGIEGAAVAAIVSSTGAVIILAFGYFRKSHRLEFSVMKSFHFDRSVMKKLLYYGYPAGVELFLYFFAFTLMIYIFQSRGDIVATASSVMFNWDMAAFVPLLGIEIAVTSLVGRYMGAGMPEVAHRSAMSGIQAGLLYALVVTSAFLVFPEPLVYIFRPDNSDHVFQTAAPIAVSMVRVASIYIIAETVMVSLIGALRGAGDTLWVMTASVTYQWLFVPVLYFMLNVLGFSPLTAWSGFVLFFMIFCAVLITRYMKGKWKLIKVV